MNPMRLSLALGAAALALTPAAAGAQKPPKTPKGGKLTLAATPNPITYGGAVTLSGKLNGRANGGQAVSVQSDPYPFAAFKTIATATTTAAGDYSLTQRPLVNTRYRSIWAAELSGVADVQVRPRVSLRLSDSTPKRGQVVRFSGRVCPQHDGRTLLIQRRTNTGYRTVRKTSLRDIAGSKCSRYSRASRVYTDGRYRAAIARHGDHATGLSASRLANAHR
ncbi:MAG TPA: hypothetical protein VEX39_12935 [Thermoleophilaceae bacterium]|nr:hypothetical protein [Thermoleophilaceae bacterium]